MFFISALLAAGAANALSQSDFTITVGATTSFYNPDDTPSNSFIDKDGSYYFQSAHSLYSEGDGRSWSFFSGADIDSAQRNNALSGYVNPSNPLDSNGNTTWRCNNSPTGIISTKTSNTYFSEPNYCDLTGMWVDPDTGDWYGLVHNEFTPAPFGDGLHYDGIDYAVSLDQGKTWKIKDRIITSPYSTVRDDQNAFPQQTYYYGDGDQRMTIDFASGYFYVWYGSRVVPKGGVSGKATLHSHVARSPIKSKMAVGSWQKFYNGQWTEPGVGGKESNLRSVDKEANGYTPTNKEYKPTTPGSPDEQIAAGTMPPKSELSIIDVAYNAHLGLWIGEPESTETAPVSQRYFATDDLTTQKWTLIGDSGSYKTGSWYRWFLDPISKSSQHIVGKSVRGYCSIERSNNAGAEYISLTFDSNAPFSAVDTSKTYKIASTAGGSLAGTYKIASTGDGAYTITSTTTGKAIWGGGEQPQNRAWGTTLSSTTIGGNPTASQQWWIIQERNTSNAKLGTFRLINRYSGLALALTSNKQELTPPRYWTDATGSGVGGGRTAAQQTLTLTPQ